MVTKTKEQVSIEEKLNKVDLSNNLQKPRLISISSKLTKEEKISLVQLLKEFKDVFTWEYGKMLGLDPNLVMHTLNVEVEPGIKLVAQPARVFLTNIEAQTVQQVQKLFAVGFIKSIQHPRWLSNIVPIVDTTFCTLYDLGPRSPMMLEF